MRPTDPVRVPSIPAASFPLPPRLEGLRRLAYNVYWSWHPRTRALFSRIDGGAWTRNRNPIPVLAGTVDWSSAPRRLRLHGRVPRRHHRVRPLHGQRRGPLVPPPARRRAEGPDRLLLCRVRPPRIAGHLLRRPGRARRRPHEGRRATWRSRSSASASCTATATSARRSTPMATRSTTTPTTTFPLPLAAGRTQGRSAAGGSSYRGGPYPRRLARAGRSRAGTPARHGRARQRGLRPPDHAHAVCPRPRDAPPPGAGPRRRRRSRDPRTRARASRLAPQRGPLSVPARRARPRAASRRAPRSTRRGRGRLGAIRSSRSTRRLRRATSASRPTSCGGWRVRWLQADAKHSPSGRARAAAGSWGPTTTPQSVRHDGFLVCGSRTGPTRSQPAPRRDGQRNLERGGRRGGRPRA